VKSNLLKKKVRQRFNKPLIDAIWEKIIEKNFLGKVGTRRRVQNSEFWAELVLNGIGGRTIAEAEATLAIESSNTGESIVSKEDA
jgi:RNase P/RNase MRP subunit p29